MTTDTSTIVGNIKDIIKLRLNYGMDQALHFGTPTTSNPRRASTAMNVIGNPHTQDSHNHAGKKKSVRKLYNETDIKSSAGGRIERPSECEGTTMIVHGDDAHGPNTGGTKDRRVRMTSRKVPESTGVAWLSKGGEPRTATEGDKDFDGEIRVVKKVRTQTSSSVSRFDEAHANALLHKSREKQSIHARDTKNYESTIPCEDIGFVWHQAHANWEIRFRELQEFQTTHKHCNVPRHFSENPQLWKWVDNQRNQYTLMSSNMTPDRVTALEDIGFVWRRTHATCWEERLEELREFRKRHKHCNVPSRRYPQLGNWVKQQRRQYKLMMDGKASTSTCMTHDRVAVLEEIGFVWHVPHAADALWGERLGELKAFQKRHNHCNVPCNFSENPQLGKWVNNQRTHYKLYTEGKKSPTTPQRIKQLEGVGGFEWARRKKSRS